MSRFPFLLTFFGLTSTYRISLFQQIHQIVFHGKGGYDWHTIYNMPIWLRNFTFSEIKKHYDNESEQLKKSSKPNNGSTSIDMTDTNKINIPDFMRKNPAAYSTNYSKNKKP